MSEQNARNNCILSILFFLVFFPAHVFGQRINFAEYEVSTATYYGEADWLVAHRDEFQNQFSTELQKIKRIELLQHEISPEEIAFWARCKNVVDIQIGELPDALSLSSTSAEQLRNFESIESLNLCLSDVADEDVLFLANMPKPLKSLSIECAFSGLGPIGQRSLGLTDASGKVFNKIEKLEQLTIRGTDFSDQFLAHIAQLPNLRKLDIGGKFSQGGLSHLKELGNLTELRISGSQPWNQAALLHLKDAKSLVCLDICVDGTFRNLGAIAQLKSLRHLTITGKVDVTAFAMFAENSSLETVSLIGESNFDKNFNVFQAMPKLKTVSFSSGPVETIKFRRGTLKRRVEGELKGDTHTS